VPLSGALDDTLAAARRGLSIDAHSMLPLKYTCMALFCLGQLHAALDA
jgi:hypothetical protein